MSQSGFLGKAMPGQAEGVTEPMGSMQPGAPRKSMGPSEPQGPDGDEESNVSPEEQAQYDKFINNAYRVIYDEKMAPQLLKKIQNAEDPKAELAMSAVNVVMTLQEKAEASGAPVSDEVLFHGGLAVVEDIANFSNVAKAYEFSNTEIEEAVMAAVDLYGSMALDAGKVDEQGAAKSYQEMLAANEEGRLEEVLPGATEGAEYAKKFGNPEQGGESNGRR